MPQRITAILPPARLQPYRDFWAASAGGSGVVPSDAAIAALYVWQVGMCSAWYEVLAYVEMVVRHALDTELGKWNAAQGNGTEWLSNPAAPLRSILGGRTISDVQGSATRAQRGRNAADPHFGPHPRQGVPVSHDDLVAQLTFGNLVHLLPNDPPTAASRQRFASGFSKHEQLWINATSKAFPNLGTIWQNRRWAGFPTSNPVPASVAPGYALSAALERLRRLRNRVGHHEQMFRVQHSHRHKDAILIVRSVSVAGALVVRGLSRVPALEAMQPRP
ncbi:hypothetical protein OS121_29680 [Mycolicibacterium mucogenicum]|uniref:hypothetical protein n=1 Tax=Mycolicibacterium mucogenicum TaxID=56689 RepID=UPI00226AEBBC|nr:hypothetical protein [Mycolicibacterium mucogenicum]MCX8559220.1 hypothetical protein [Mycolicibacterium mucogenicum]